MRIGNSFIKKIRVYALTLVLMSGIMTIFTMPAYALLPLDVSVNDFTQLQTAVEKNDAAATDDVVVTISTSFRVSAVLTVPSPATGMNVSVRIGTGSGVIVEANANETHAAYFSSDHSVNKVVHEGGQLKIVAP